MATLNINKNEKKSVDFGNINFLEALFLLFLGLKLGNVIDWSWWWVFSPIWIPLAAIGIFIIVFVIILIVKNLIKNGVKKG